MVGITDETVGLRSLAQLPQFPAARGGGEVYHSTTTHRAPGGNDMTLSIEARTEDLQRVIDRSQRELAFLTSLPHEPDVDDQVEPTVVLINRLHLHTGAVEESTVARSVGNHRHYVSWSWNGGEDVGHIGDWDDMLRRLYSPEYHLEVRQLNPGTVIYTTVPQGDDQPAES